MKQGSSLEHSTRELELQKIQPDHQVQFKSNLQNSTIKEVVQETSYQILHPRKIMQ